MTENQKLAEITAAIAAELGNGWTGSPTLNGEGELCYFQRLTHADGPSLNVAWGQYPQKNRIVIRANYPKNADSEVISPKQAYNDEINQNWLDITVSDQKSPAAVAKDITRRLLPDYGPQWAACMARVHANNTYKMSKDAARDYIGTLPGVSGFTKNCPDETYVRQQNERLGKVRVNSADSIEISLNGLSLEEATAILAMVTKK